MGAGIRGRLRGQAESRPWLQGTNCYSTVSPHLSLSLGSATLSELTCNRTNCIPGQSMQRRVKSLRYPISTATRHCCLRTCLLLRARDELSAEWLTLLQPRAASKLRCVYFLALLQILSKLCQKEIVLVSQFIPCCKIEVLKFE